MKKSRIIASAAVVAVGLTLVASPAFAYTWNGSDIYYPFTNDGTDSSTDSQYYSLGWDDFAYSGMYSQSFANDGPDSNLFDTHTFFTGAGSDYVLCNGGSGSTVTEATDGSGDIILLCAPETMNGIDGQFEFRMFADHKTTRSRLILTNNSGADITNFTAGRDINMYVDGGTNVGWTSSGGSTMSTWPNATGVGGLTVTNGDTSYVITAPPSIWNNHGSHQAWYTALGDADGAVQPYFPIGLMGGNAEADSAGDYQLEAYDFQIADGQTVNLVWMNREYLFSFGSDAEGAALESANAAITDAEATTWCAGNPKNQLMVGIADASSIINWGTATTDCPNAQADPELPNTGLDSAKSGLLAAGAAVLALAGVALTVVRRRRTA